MSLPSPNKPKLSRAQLGTFELGSNCVWVHFPPLAKRRGEKIKSRESATEGRREMVNAKMARVLIAKAKKEVISGRHLTIAKERTYYIRELGKQLHVKEGKIDAKQLKAKSGSAIKTALGREFCIFDSGFHDDWKKITRGPQIMLPKEIGFIIAELGLDSKSIVVEAGTGSGGLACALAHICRKIFSYDINQENTELGKANAKQLRLKNITFKTKDITKGIDEKDVDAVILDLPESSKAINAAEKALAIGGFLVSYSPTVIPMQRFANEIENNSRFILLKNLELIQRDWKIEGESARPVSTMASHTGFLTIARKICK